MKKLEWVRKDTSGGTGSQYYNINVIAGKKKQRSGDLGDIF